MPLRIRDQHQVIYGDAMMMPQVEITADGNERLCVGDMVYLTDNGYITGRPRDDRAGRPIGIVLDVIHYDPDDRRYFTMTGEPAVHCQVRARVFDANLLWEERYGRGSDPELPSPAPPPSQPVQPFVTPYIDQQSRIVRRERCSPDELASDDPLEA